MNSLSAIIDVERPVPPVRSFSAPFWEGTRDKRLMLQYDRFADAYQFYPRPTSIHTGRSGNLEWRQSAGRGTLFTYTVIERARPPFRGLEPYVLGMVTLNEGINVMSNIVHCERDRLAKGLRLKLLWVPLPDGRHLPLFEPDDNAD